MELLFDKEFLVVYNQCTEEIKTEYWSFENSSYPHGDVFGFDGGKMGLISGPSKAWTTRKSAMH